MGLCVLVAACSVGPGGQLASPGSTAPTDALLPSAVATGIGEEAITYPADNMWAFLATMPGLQRRSDTLAAAVAFSDIVAVGRFVGVERGAQYGSDSTAVALISLNSVAKGSPKLGSDGLLRIEFVLVVGSQRYPEKQFADIQRSIPKDPALLYLFTWESYFKLVHEKLPGWSDRTDLGSVYKTIGGDGAMRIVDGRIDPPSYVDGWPMSLRDSPIETVMTRIRAAVATGTP